MRAHVLAVLAALVSTTAGQGLAFAEVGAEEAPAAAPLVTSPPQDPKEEAIRRFQRGLELHEEGDHGAALMEFRRAYELSPTYKVLFNIGQLCFQTQDYACAFQSFQRYLKEGGKNISSQRQADVAADIQKLSLRVATIEIVTRFAGADVMMDDVLIGHTPLPSPVVVNAGRRKLRATAPGRVSDARILDVAGTDSIRVELDLPLIHDEAQAPVAAPRMRAIPPRMTTYSWIGVGAAGATALTGGVMGVLALRASASLKSADFVGTNVTPEMQSSSSRVKTFRTLCDVSLGVSVVTLAATLALTYLRGPTMQAIPATSRVGFDGTTVQFVF